MAAAFVQSKFAGTTSGSSIAAAYNSNNTGGNFLIACFAQFNGGGLTNQKPTISDTQSNTWFRLSFAKGATPTITGAIYFCPNCKAGANTVTVNPGQAGIELSLHLMEFSGLAITGAFDVDVSVISGASNVNTQNNVITPSQIPTLLIAFGCSNNAATVSVPGFNKVFQDTTNVASGSFYQFVNAAGAVTVVFNQTATSFFATMVVALAAPQIQQSIPGGQISIGVN